MPDRDPIRGDGDLIALIFRNALDLDESYELDDSMVFESVPGWDSLGHARIVAEIETLIGAVLELEQIVELDSVAKIRYLIEARTK